MRFTWTPKAASACNSPSSALTRGVRAHRMPPPGCAWPSPWRAQAWAANSSPASAKKCSCNSWAAEPTKPWCWARCTTAKAKAVRPPRPMVKQAIHQKPSPLPKAPTTAPAPKATSWANTAAATPRPGMRAQPVKQPSATPARSAASRAKNSAAAATTNSCLTTPANCAPNCQQPGRPNQPGPPSPSRNHAAACGPGL